MQNTFISWNQNNLLFNGGICESMVIMMNKATHGTRESYSDAAIANEKLTK